MPAVPFGKMRDRVTIQSRSVSAGPAGQPLLTWTSVAEVWARVEPLGATEQTVAAAVTAIADHLVIIRYFPGLTTEHRLLLGGRTFGISGIVDLENRHRQHNVFCKEGV